MSEKAKARDYIKDRQPSLYAFFISNFAYMRLRIGLFPEPTSNLQPFLVFVYEIVLYTSLFFEAFISPTGGGKPVHDRLNLLIRKVLVFGICNYLVD